MAKVVEMRDAVTVALHEIEGEHVVEAFDRDRFCHSLTVAENLLFGTPVDTSQRMEDLLMQPRLVKILQSAGLYGDFVRIGSSLTDLMLELFSGVDESSDLFTRYSFIDAASLQDYKELSVRIRQRGLEHCDSAEQTMLVSLALKLCPDKHRLNLVDENLARRIVETREVLEAALRNDDPSQVLFIDRDSYHAGFTVRANMLFGVIRYNRRHLLPAINQRLIDVFEAFGMSRDLLDVGLDTHSGVAGGNLTRVFRQKLLLARALVKNPDILVVDNALTALDRESQQELMSRVCALREGKNLVWSFSEAEFASLFDRVLEISDGQVREYASG
jgi:ABC-type branched-subunit amino acid transport system ATPase component